MAKSLRRLVKLPAIADAYAQDLVARGVRRAIGDLACDDDKVIAHALASRTTEPLLCALTVTVTCRAPGIDLMAVVAPRMVAVPGYPATALDDETGPWQRAFAAASELGADTSVFWDAVAEHGVQERREHPQQRRREPDEGRDRREEDHESEREHRAGDPGKRHT